MPITNFLKNATKEYVLSNTQMEPPSPGVRATMSLQRAPHLQR